ncbi:hypothetical protein D9O40_06695 [Clostridium autoethanogenum]|uniref:Uncharacterized protein n=1 Tax=Clostridium autoethanogenum TaxID=84023 RepID=A0A3M0SV69_9CLOT|nr:hypothetical protein [Clostridium autoethanogenum]RMD02319.1 hypothetical protein D9O40_06695 [Clostridium autoethanogenum]
MGLIDDALDWAADKVQTVTGEKERRQLVSELKNRYIEFKENVQDLITVLNQVIGSFNNKIKELNDLRKGVVGKNIMQLSSFLGKFGKVKEIGEYCREEEKKIRELPQQKFDSVENYISDVDWSKDDVFMDTFKLSPIFMKLKTRKQNLSMRENLNEFCIEAENTIMELKSRTFTVEQDKKICEIYIDCVRYVSKYIEDIILPELELVEAFFQSQKIKDEIIANNPLQELVFKNNIEVLKNTVYKKHYLFVKNTFMFYVLSCKIYNTPILTRLLTNQTTSDDVNSLEKQKQALLLQASQVSENLIISA